MSLSDWAEQIRSALSDAPGTALLLRPNIPKTPQAVRSVLEPIVAGAALALLIAFLSLGFASFMTLMLCSGLIYAILTRVFGLELSVNA